MYEWLKVWSIGCYDDQCFNFDCRYCKRGMIHNPNDIEVESDVCTIGKMDTNGDIVNLIFTSVLIFEIFAYVLVQALSILKYC